jgi:hypothetical protein
MAAAFDLYKLFYDSDLEIQITVPKSIIKGEGYDSIIYMTNKDGYIKYAEIKLQDIPDVIDLWKKSKDDYAIVKQNARAFKYKHLLELSDEFLCQEYLKDPQEVIIKWDAETGINELQATTLGHSYEYLKNCLNTVEHLINSELNLFKLRLKFMEIRFIYSKGVYYCLDLKSCKLFSQPRQFLPGIIKNKKTVFYTKNKPTVADKIENAIKALNKNQESIKNITYTSWINKISQGEKLYPNEDFFAKNIAKHMKLESKIGIKCINDLRSMCEKMRIALFEKKIQAEFHEGIKNKLETVRNKKKRALLLKKPLIENSKSLNIQEISLKSAKNLLISSTSKLNLVSKSSRV